MVKKLFIFLFLTGSLIHHGRAQELSTYFQKNVFFNSFQLIEREKEPYKITSFSIDEQSLGQLARYDLSKFTLVTQVKIASSKDSVLIAILTQLSKLPQLRAIEFAEYPIFPPRDRSMFGKKKFPVEIGLFSKLEAVAFSLYKTYDWDDILTKLSSLPLLKRLDVNLSYFKEVPVSLRKLPNLYSLTLYDNEFIESLPAWISEFKNLEHLNISQNPKMDYANAFVLLGKLPRLRSLELSYCRFDEFPASIGNLHSLQKFSAFGLNIKNLDNFFTVLSGLPALTELWFRAGDSMVLPRSIGDLKKLEKLTLESRKITFLPEEIGNLTELRTLSLPGNRLTELPTSFYQLKKLESVDLGYNQIRFISDEIGSLKNIEELQLNKNALEELPVSIGKLEKCRKLWLSDNRISRIPETISSIKTLEELTVANNRLTSLFSDFSMLQQLTRLEAHQNSITELHPSIGQLKNLKTLLLQNNLLETIPASICSLEKLETLFLSNNNLKELPADMGNLQNLASLDLISGKPITGPVGGQNVVHQNSFRYLPVSLSRLKKLRSLFLANNTMLDGDSAIRVVFRMQAPADRFDLSNCNINSLPADGWKDCRIQYLDLGNNNISVVPAGILDAPVLRYLRLSNNPVPPAFKTAWDSKEQFMVTAAENGLLQNYSLLPHTAAMCKALYEMGNTHFIYKRYDKTLFLYNLADSLFDETTKKSAGNTRRKDNLGISQYHAGQYEKAISNISTTLRQDTAMQVRIMNFIDPQFQYLTLSYLAVKDTASAIDTYRKWSGFGYNANALAEAALLSLISGKKTQGTELALKATDMYRKGRDQAPLTLLSILEIFVVNGIHDSVNNFTATVDISRFSKEQKILLEYLVAVDHIANKTSSAAEQNLLLVKIAGLAYKKESWSYDFFESWLDNAVFEKEQQSKIRELTDAIKEKIHS